MIVRGSRPFQGSCREGIGMHRPFAGVSLLLALLVAAVAGTTSLSAGEGDRGTERDSSPSYPTLVTAETRANPQALARLQRHGQAFFRDDFESPDSVKKYFEIRGLKRGPGEAGDRRQAGPLRAGRDPVHRRSPGRPGVGGRGQRLVWARGLRSGLLPPLHQVRRRLRPGRSEPRGRRLGGCGGHRPLSGDGLSRHPSPRRRPFQQRLRALV